MKSKSWRMTMRSVKISRCRSVAAMASWMLIVLFAGSEPAAVGATITDPAGDTFAAGPDITSVSTSLTGVNQSTLQITVNFGRTIFAPSSFHVNSLGGWILLDTNGDANMASSLSFLISNLPPAAGIDLSIDLFSEEFQLGFANLLNSNLNFVAALPVSFGATSLTVSVPVSSLGVTNPNMGVVVGTFDQATDIASSATAGPVPEPGSFTLFSLLAGIAGGLHCRRRRKSVVRARSCPVKA
jgi:PEP-CTERM motif